MPRKAGRPDLVLAFDLGASALKLGLVAPSGALAAFETVPCAIPAPQGDVSEAAPEAWWRALVSGARTLLARVPPRRIAGIAGTGMTRTQVLVDGAGRAQGRAITFLDRRAVAEAADLAATGAELPETWTAYHPLARLLWLARHAPKRLLAARAVLEPKDYLVALITGALPADTVSQHRVRAALDALAARPSRPTLPVHLLPRAVPPHALAGRVRPGLPKPFDALAGLPVSVGGMDAWAATLGMGVMAPGDAYIVTGTSESTGWLAPKPVPAPGILDVPWLDGLVQQGGPSQLGSAALEWAKRALAPRSKKRASVPPLFLPFLAGARAPLWDAGLRGAWLGLDLGHDAADLAEAVRLGVALVNRDILSRATGGRLDRLGEIKLAGGPAADAAWCQAKADALGRPVRRVSVREPGLVGAAWALRRALAAEDRPYRAFVPAPKGGRVFRPDPARARRLDALFPVFRAAQSAIGDWSRRIAAAGGAGGDA
jgi:xylulokinase